MTSNKSEVQRYDDMGCPEQICRVDTMHESDDGDYVLYEDYETLQAECEKLRKDAGGLLEALKACRDELRWMIERHNHQNQNDGSWLYDYQTVEEAHAALAAYRKQGGEQ